MKPFKAAESQFGESISRSMLWRSYCADRAGTQGHPQNELLVIEKAAKSDRKDQLLRRCALQNTKNQSRRGTGIKKRKQPSTTHPPYGCRTAEAVHTLECTEKQEATEGKKAENEPRRSTREPNWTHRWRNSFSQVAHADPLPCPHFKHAHARACGLDTEGGTTPE